MRPVLVPLLLTHTIFSIAVVFGLLTHEKLRYRAWMPEFRTLGMLGVFAILAAAALVFMIVVFLPRDRSRPWEESRLALRAKAVRRAKWFVRTVAFTFLAGGFTIAAYELFFPGHPSLGKLATSLLACSTALFIVISPWLALYAAWFDIDPAS